MRFPAFTPEQEIEYLLAKVVEAERIVEEGKREVARGASMRRDALTELRARMSVREIGKALGITGNAVGAYLRNRGK